jgi:hypothetical protein
VSQALLRIPSIQLEMALRVRNVMVHLCRRQRAEKRLSSRSYGVFVRRSQLKLARAAEHLESLNEEVASYLDSRPYEVVQETQPEGNPLLVCKVNSLPPMRLSVLLGDFLHNLRSALDHLAWQLVLVNGSTPGKRTGFPIYHPFGGCEG